MNRKKKKTKEQKEKINGKIEQKMKKTENENG